MASDGTKRVVRVAFPWRLDLAGSDAQGNYYRWRPGIRWEESYSDKEAVADGIGAMHLIEVGRYTPPGFGPRVFYTRQFELPSGELVGHQKLRVIGAAGFTRLCRGYRYPFEVVDTLKGARMEPEYLTEDYADAASL